VNNYLAKELKDAGFNPQEIIDDVTIVEDFLSKEEIEYLYKIMENLTQDDWEKEYLDNLPSFCMEKFGRDDVENLVAEGKFEITQNWKDKNYNIGQDPIYNVIYSRLNDIVDAADNTIELSGLATIQRMQEEVELKAHTDQNTDPSIRYATIIYLNDDYAGGELFFSEKNLELRPKPGTLVVFPGTQEFNHGVKHVEAGPIRYVIVGFVKEKNFYVNNKY
jgi:hypothetical protein